MLKMNDNKLITVAIPFYNDEAHLQSAIHSVLNQTYRNWELILINDGSSDESLEIAKKAAAADPRITVYSDGMNKGLANRLNESIKYAKGILYARMDADDVMDIERLEKQVNFLEGNPNIDILGTSAYVIDSDNNITGCFKQVKETPTTVKDILGGNVFIHPSIIGKTAWFRDNPYDEELIRMQDLGLWLRTVEISNFFILKDKLLFYRAGGMRTMNKNIREYKSLKRLYFQILWKEQHRYALATFSYTKELLTLIVYGFLSLINKIDILEKYRFIKIDSIERIKAEEKLSLAVKAL